MTVCVCFGGHFQTEKIRRTVEPMVRPHWKRKIRRQNGNKNSVWKQLSCLFVCVFANIPTMSGPSPPPPPPPVPPVPPTPPTRRSGHSRAKFDANFRTIKTSGKRRRHQRDDVSDARILLQWTTSESSPEKTRTSSRPAPTSATPLNQFKIDDETGKWTFEEYASNRNGGATWVVNLNDEPLFGGFRQFDKASFSHSLDRCRNQTVKMDRFQLPPHLRYKGYGPKALAHLLQLYKEAGCTKIICPSPTPQGAKCYLKVGFSRNALGTLEFNFASMMSDPQFEEGKCSPRADCVRVQYEDIESDSRHSNEVEDNSNDDDDFLTLSEEDISCSNDSGDLSSSTENTASDALLPKTSGTSKAGFTKRVKGWFCRSKSLDEKELQSLNDKNWTVERCEFKGNRTGFVRLKEINSDNSYEVLPSRVPKAKLNLSYDACMTAMMTDACQCRKKCNQLLLDPKKVGELRYPVYACTSEQEVGVHLVEKIKANGGKYLVPVEGEMRKVCPQYYSRVHSVSLHRVKRAAKCARRGKYAAKTKRKSCADKRADDSAKHNIAFSFWFVFFEQNCQRPNNEVRIFPVDKSYNLIYQEYFTPWFERQVEKGALCESDKPSRSTFMRARKHEDFKDVKERAKHIHARCLECAHLKHLVLEGFRNGAAEEEYLQRRRLHDTEVRNWRELESIYKTQAVNDPSKVLVIMHDGTESLGLPRLTNRTLKYLDPTRFEVVPWLGEDHSGQRKDYVYSVKNAFPKNANTLISQVHVMIRRAQADYNHPRHKARRLVLIADSASENKNNILFAYVTDLVENKWFDEVELVFGPVGHTHNGVDACHKIHNQNVGGCASGDIGHFVQNFPKGYSGELTVRPQASFLSRAVDWISYYEPCVRKIAGFTKSKNDPYMVRGFRVARQQDNTVSVTWKMDPASEKEWRGADGFGGTTGFYMLKSAPEGLPAFVEPPDATEEERLALRKLASKNMQTAMNASGLSLASMEYNHLCALEKKIITHSYVDDETPPGEWGRACLVGGGDETKGVLREIKDYWDPNLPQVRASLWALPVGPQGEHHSATNTTFHFSNDQALMESRRLALVRYADERSQVGNHPNNAVQDGAGGWVQEENSVENPEAAPAPAASVPGDPDGEAAISEANRVWRFEEDFSKCVKNAYCVGLVETSVGPSPYVFVGKITSVNKKEKTFRYKPHTSTVDPWTITCLEKPWHIQPGSTYEENPHYSVMFYFKMLKQNKAIPKKAADAVKSRNIQWTREAS